MKTNLFVKLWAKLFGAGANSRSVSEDLVEQHKTPEVASTYVTPQDWIAATEEERLVGLQELNSRFEASGKCPDCGEGKLLLGPEGGSSVNICCNHCGEEFMAVYGFSAAGIQIFGRILDGGLERKLWLYERGFDDHAREVFGVAPLVQKVKDRK